MRIPTSCHGGLAESKQPVTPNIANAYVCGDALALPCFSGVGQLGSVFKCHTVKPTFYETVLAETLDSLAVVLSYDGRSVEKLP